MLAASSMTSSPSKACSHSCRGFLNIFEVALTGEMNSKKKPKYTFKLLPAINELAATAEPAVGGNGGGAGAAGSSGDGIGVVAPPATVSYYGPRPQTMPVPGNS